MILFVCLIDVWLLVEVIGSCVLTKGLLTWKWQFLREWEECARPLDAWVSVWLTFTLSHSISQSRLKGRRSIIHPLKKEMECYVARLPEKWVTASSNLPQVPYLNLFRKEYGLKQNQTGKKENKRGNFVYLCKCIGNYGNGYENPYMNCIYLALRCFYRFFIFPFK